MKKCSKWVVEFLRVSSERKTKIFSLVFVLVMLAASSFTFFSAGNTIASDITIEKVIDLTNISRGESGENVLKANLKLSQAAEEKAEDMIANNYFAHTSPAGKTPWSWIQKEGYDYVYAGENLAMDFQTAEKMENAWMTSPTHRANILNQNYQEIGAAVKEGIINGHETILAVVMFGSGDKNSSGADETSVSETRKESLDSKKNVDGGENFPTLSVGDEKRGADIFEQPTITSPQPSEILSESIVRIAGRAEPGEGVAIFDNGNLVGSAVADQNGWFFFVEKGLSEGAHSLALKNSKSTISKSATDFFVDREKPEIDFHLFADESDPDRFFLEASVDKNNCTFQFNGESRYVSWGSKALFSVGSDKSSVILRVTDQSGNKNFRQISLVNYFSGIGNKKNISENLASRMVRTENIFAADSGKKAVKNNLGLAMGGINNY
jgi:hypothetical protein